MEKFSYLQENSPGFYKLKQMVACFEILFMFLGGDIWS